MHFGSIRTWNVLAISAASAAVGLMVAASPTLADATPAPDASATRAATAEATSTDMSPPAPDPTATPEPDPTDPGPDPEPTTPPGPEPSTPPLPEPSKSPTARPPLKPSRPSSSVSNTSTPTSDAAVVAGGADQGPGLPVTGVRVASITAVGSGAVLIGAGLVLAGRRRKIG